MPSRGQRQGIFALGAPVLICLWCAMLGVAGGPGWVMASETEAEPATEADGATTTGADQAGGEARSAAAETAGGSAPPVPAESGQQAREKTTPATASSSATATAPATTPATESATAPTTELATTPTTELATAPTTEPSTETEPVATATAEPTTGTAAETTGGPGQLTGIFQAGMLEGVGGQFRILLWLGLSATLSWVLTLFLYRRWFARDRHQQQSAAELYAPVTGATSNAPAKDQPRFARLIPGKRLRGWMTGRRDARDESPEASEATTRFEVPASTPAAVPVATDLSTQSLVSAAAALATAAGQIAGQIEQLQRLTGVPAAGAPAPAPTGLFEPVAGGELPTDELPPIDDELADVEPRGLM